jgi:hypothetical protein
METIDYGPAAEAFLATLNRAAAAAVDIAVMKEAGVRTGPTFTPSTQAPPQLLQHGVASSSYSGAAGWLSANWPLLAFGLAGVLVAAKLLGKAEG